MLTIIDSNYLCIVPYRYVLSNFVEKKIMANHGMHPTRIFKTPEELKEAFDNYKAWLQIEAQRWLKVQYVGKNGTRKTDAQKVPMTMEGFERYSRENYGLVGQYFDNKDGYYEDFVTICSQIRKEIREDQIIGGLLGFYNPSITQRLNGLVDKQENKVTVEQPLFGDDSEG